MECGCDVERGRVWCRCGGVCVGVTVGVSGGREGVVHVWRSMCRCDGGSQWREGGCGACVEEYAHVVP